MNKVLAFVFLMMSGCYHILTGAELAAHGTRQFSQVSRAQAVAASATALETLGYKITVKEVERGIIKTAPRVIMVNAVGGPGYANASEDALAWNVVVEDSASGAVIHAEPRGFRNGTEISERGMPDILVDPKFRDLFKEISSTLGVAPVMEQAPQNK